MTSNEKEPQASVSKAVQRPRRKGVQEHPLGDELLLYTPEMARAFSFNQSAQAVWELCDGHRTLLDISRDLAQRYDAPSDQLLGDVKAAVQRFQELGLLEPEPLSSS